MCIEMKCIEMKCIKIYILLIFQQTVLFADKITQDPESDSGPGRQCLQLTDVPSTRFKCAVVYAKECDVCKEKLGNNLTAAAIATSRVYYPFENGSDDESAPAPNAFHLRVEISNRKPNGHLSTKFVVTGSKVHLMERPATTGKEKLALAFDFIVVQLGQDMVDFSSVASIGLYEELELTISPRPFLDLTIHPIADGILVVTSQYNLNGFVTVELVKGHLNDNIQNLIIKVAIDPIEKLQHLAKKMCLGLSRDCPAAAATAPPCPRPVCENNGDFHPHANRNMYWQCALNVPIEKPCPSELVFNPTLNVCDFTGQAECAK